MGEGNEANLPLKSFLKKNETYHPPPKRRIFLFQLQKYGNATDICFVWWFYFFGVCECFTIYKKEAVLVRFFFFFGLLAYSS